MATARCTFEPRAVCAATGARTGTLRLPHGPVATPAFMPVATYGAVKGLTGADLRSLGADIVLSNTFHLMSRPGADTLQRLGGLHRFMAWDGPILVDSGGFQVFSLRELRRVDEGGVTFRDPHSGSPIRLTPESVVDAQIRMGVDIGMVLDDCPPLPGKSGDVRDAMARTHRWAARAAQVPRDDAAPALFGIVQGGLDEAMRRESIDALLPLGFEGYALGGLSVGEEPAAMVGVIQFAAPRLPADKPRYLMGVGYPEDIVEAVAAGIDMFDCVLPSRNARNGQVFTSEGRIVLKNAAWREDGRPLDERCDCFTCRTYSRAYLRHLLMAGDPLLGRLTTVHNLRHYQGLLGAIRDAIAAGTFPAMLRAARDRQGGLPPSRRHAPTPPPFAEPSEGVEAPCSNG
jgi:queuine tRNA-ribosyltransferase